MFAGRGGYFVVVGDLSTFEGYWSVEGYSRFLSGYLGDEPEKMSGVQRALTGL